METELQAVSAIGAHNKTRRRGGQAKLRHDEIPEKMTDTKTPRVRDRLMLTGLPLKIQGLAW